MYVVCRMRLLGFYFGLLRPARQFSQILCYSSYDGPQVCFLSRQPFCRYGTFFLSRSQISRLSLPTRPLPQKPALHSLLLTVAVCNGLAGGAVLYLPRSMVGERDVVCICILVRAYRNFMYAFSRALYLLLYRSSSDTARQNRPLSQGHPGSRWFSSEYALLRRLSGREKS